MKISSWEKTFSLRDKGVQFIVYNIFSFIIFGILYWLSELFIYNNPELSTSLNIGNLTTLYNLDDYLHFSLTTQTTVGYGGLGAITHPLNKHYNKNHYNRIFEILNTLQLFSIIYIFGIAFQSN